MVGVDDSSLQQTCSLSVDLSEGRHWAASWRCSTFIGRTTGWSLEMVLLWWQYHKHCSDYYQLSLLL